MTKNNVLHPTHLKGVQAQYIACLYYLSIGHYPCVPMVDKSAFDLLIAEQYSTYKVQVKFTSYGKQDRTSDYVVKPSSKRQKFNLEHFDKLFVVTPDGFAEYSASEFTGKTEVSIFKEDLTPFSELFNFTGQ